MAERENVSGEAFLRAVILGYDIGSRTTKALGRNEMRARNHLPFSIGASQSSDFASRVMSDSVNRGSSKPKRRASR